MATHLDLEEQEQLDQLKAFWKKYGNLITWVLVAVLGAYAAWNGWNWWQRDQAVKAGAMFDQLDKAAQAGDTDQAARIFADLKDRYPRTAFTEQGGLLVAKAQFDKGKADDALATLGWVHRQNPRRLHGYLDDRTPTEYDQAFYAAHRADQQPVGIP